MGSISDEETVRPCAELLEKLGIGFRIAVSSAHRTPERTETLVREAERDGCRVFICAAGMAAHLAGAVAARTVRPVIGIPVTASSLGGLDAVLSTLMMPPGFPVATLALDKAGARNAAWLAAQILALNDESLTLRLREERAAMARGVEEASRRLAGNPRPSPTAGPDAIQ
jgi:5-(carboxyamino)imidazole ribonucleotide mutase